jgi:hypothetical protein
MPITMSFKFFFSAKQQAKLEKSLSNFLAWDIAKFTKQMEEHMKKNLKVFLHNAPLQQANPCP